MFAIDHSDERPARPHLPLLLWVLVVTLVSIWTTLTYNPNPADLLVALAVLWTIVLMLCLLAWAGGCAQRACFPIVLATVITLACLCAQGELATQVRAAELLQGGRLVQVEFLIETDMRATPYGFRGRASAWIDGVCLGNVWLSAPDTIPAQTRVRCRGSFKATEPGEKGAWSRTRGVAGSLQCRQIVSSHPQDGIIASITRVRERVLRGFDPDRSEERALLAGTVCGSDEAARTSGISDVMAACGTSHLVAVSGGHLVYICALLQVILKKIRLRPSLRILAMLIGTGAFVCFCGAPASALRSWAMGMVASGAELAGRRGHALSGACVVGLVMALSCPSCVGDLGFLLSITCVCGICLFAPYMSYILRTLMGQTASGTRVPSWLGSQGKRFWKTATQGLVEALGLTLISQFITLPLTVPIFGTVSLVAPLANVLLTLPFSGLLLCGLGAAATTWVWWLQPPLLWACDALGVLITSIAHTLARLPLASVPLSCDVIRLCCVVGICLIAWLVWWPRCTRVRALCVICGPTVLLIAWLVGGALVAPAEFTVLDVGQGDALLIRDGWTTILIDTGPDDAVVKALAKRGVWSLDAVLLTHVHEDHVGGLAALSRRIPVKQVFIARGTDHSYACGLPVVEVGAGDVLTAGCFSFQVVWPTSSTDGTKNEDSIVGHLIFDDTVHHFEALLTGDAEADTLHQIVLRDDVSGIDVVKVGHHGSAQALDADLMKQLNPRIGLISAGLNNRFGHPDQCCLELLAASNTTVFCTAECGNLTCFPEKQGVRISYERPPPG